ncbi:hypothetical protein [Bifidobacterium longum]|nr:hypothetical protein [Bifidobacterium longum]
MVGDDTVTIWSIDESRQPIRHGSSRFVRVDSPLEREYALSWVA